MKKVAEIKENSLLTEDLEDKLINCESLQEFVTMYFDLSMEDKQSIFTEEITIQKNKEFYRARKIKSFNNSNIEDPKEWGPPPKEIVSQGRFNRNKESVLYVASDPFDLEREIRLKDGEEYYLAKYRCKKSFSVGSFMTNNNPINTLFHDIAMAVSSSDDLSPQEISLLDEYYKSLKKMSLYDLSRDMLLPLYIYRMIPHLYDITNQLADIVLSKNENGIRFSSAFLPMEKSGWPINITLNGLEYGNFALTDKGYENIELVSVEKKMNRESRTLESFIEMFSDLKLDI